MMDPDIHDLLVAQTSHLPHVLSSAFAKQIAGAALYDSNTPKILSGSFRDMTRIADSNSAQWAEICFAKPVFATIAWTFGLESRSPSADFLANRAEASVSPEIWVISGASASLVRSG